jgi:hypothetical protein
MKKIIILTFLMLTIKAHCSTMPVVPNIEAHIKSTSLLAARTGTYSQINRSKGGLFGYRSVNTDKDHMGNTVTDCRNPGLKKCIASPYVVVVDDAPMPSEDAQRLDAHVEGLITENSHSGTFLYDNYCVVSYTYNVDTDLLSYNVYSIQTATELGINW